ncbi:MAG: AI-2E family transporter [Armatimonadota bacterium]|nr:AI-2E family transporter [Armatimonadota bacterium]
MAIVLVAALFLYLVRSILFPFVFGLVAAALLDPSIRFLRKKGFSRGLAVFSMLIVFFAVIVGAGVLIAPRIASQVGAVQTNVTNLIRTELFPPTRVDSFLADRLALEDRELLAEKYPLEPGEFGKWLRDPNATDDTFTDFFGNEADRLAVYDLPSERDQLIQHLETPVKPGWIDKMLVEYKGTLQKVGLPTTRTGLEEMFQVKKTVGSMASRIFGNVAGVLQYATSSIFLLVLTPLVTALILMNYDDFRRRFVTWIPPTIRPAATDLLSDLGDVVSGYVRGLTKSVLLYSAINAVLFTLLGVPFGLLLGLLVGVFYVIPYVGFLISSAAIWIAIVSGDSSGFLGIEMSKGGYIILVLVVYIAVGLIYDSVVHPQLVGKSVGLHPVVSVFVVLCGGALLGIVGMLLAFPLAGMVKVILDRLIRYTTTSAGDGVDLPRVPSRHQT